jgi:hypothetical protein
MNMILDILSGKKDYVTIVKEFIYKVFQHEAKKYQCEPKDLMIVIDCDQFNSAENLKILTFSKKENVTWRVIPDKEVQEILMK